ncbi:hypothetical protein U9M48_027541, partial [Paspalum notatum var. saurae]
MMLKWLNFKEQIKSDHSFPKDEDASALSDQTESERMKENSEKALNANDSNGSDQSERDMVNEAKTHT